MATIPDREKSHTRVICTDWTTTCQFAGYKLMVCIFWAHNSTRCEHVEINTLLLKINFEMTVINIINMYCSCW